MKNNIIHCWVPGVVASSGGIQSYSCCYLKALMELRPEQPYHIYIKNDKAEEVPDDIAQAKKLTCFGIYPKVLQKLLFFLSLFFWCFVRSSKVDYGNAR